MLFNVGLIHNVSAAGILPRINTVQVHVHKMSFSVVKMLKKLTYATELEKGWEQPEQSQRATPSDWSNYS